MNISQNLSHIIKEKKITQKALSKQLGVPTSTINNWIKLNRSIPSEFIIPICEFLDITPYLLLTGENVSSKSVLDPDEQELLDIYNSLSPKSQGRLRERAEVLAELEAPVVKEPEPEQETIFIEYSTLKVSAGTGEPLIDDTYHDFLKVKRSDLTEEANFAVQISGNSMLPRFKDKEWVLVRSQPDVEIGEIGIFIIDGNGYIKERAADRLVSINPEYDDIFFKENQDIKCKGLVIGTLESDDFV